MIKRSLLLILSFALVSCTPSPAVPGTEQSSSASSVAMEEKEQQLHAENFEFTTPFGWELRKDPKDSYPTFFYRQLFEGNVEKVSVHCPIPEWDAEMGLGEPTVQERTFVQGGEEFKASLFSYKAPAFFLYVYPTSFQKEMGYFGGAPKSCAFVARTADVESEMIGILNSIR